MNALSLLHHIIHGSFDFVDRYVIFGNHFDAVRDFRYKSHTLKGMEWVELISWFCSGQWAESTPTVVSLCLSAAILSKFNRKGRSNFVFQGQQQCWNWPGEWELWWSEVGLLVFPPIFPHSVPSFHSKMAKLVIRFCTFFLAHRLLVSATHHHNRRMGRGGVRPDRVHRMGGSECFKVFPLSFFFF